MSQMIAGIYEIKQQIGAGGGGIVYLGRHTRLQKQVVLKADKRELCTKTEVLRREVDMLKDLSHTYIPKVYDFVQENGVVYTVMDFIEGESLDKYLAGNEVPTQPELIKWACEVLEALSYLHNRPPHGILHGDIKPANIMLRPNGDICLIDYNIALALGEDGAVKVGFSKGYASPEHYGMDYIKANRGIAIEEKKGINIKKQNEWAKNKTELLKHTEIIDRTVVLNKEADFRKTEPLGSSMKSSVMLDVRSDIYSLGATLYHLISGQKPAQDAREVKPLSTAVCSPTVAAIIKKAMEPQPDMRYQSAEEMLKAFKELYKKDIRAIQYKRGMVVSGSLLLVLMGIGTLCTYLGLNQMKQRENAYVLAEYSADALEKGDVSEAVALALQAIPNEKNIWNAPVTAQAQKALTDALGVYDLTEGFKAFESWKLPAAPFKISVSPEGTRLAVVYAYEMCIFDMETCQKIVTLPVQKSALSDVVFADENYIIYAGENGVTAFDIETKEVVWTGETATTLSISSDKKILAAVNREKEYAIIYETDNGRIVTKQSFFGNYLYTAINDIFADPSDIIFSLNQKGNRLAVSFQNGALFIYDLEDSNKSMVVYERSDYQKFEGGFYDKYFAYTAGNGKEAIFGLVDIEAGIYLGEYSSKSPFLLKVDKNGLYLANENLLVEIKPDTLEEKEMAFTSNADITAFAVCGDYILTATDENTFSLFDKGAQEIFSEDCNERADFTVLTKEYAVIGNRSEPTLRLLKHRRHNGKQLLSYDIDYSHDEARISTDEKKIMLFSLQGFRIYDTDGRIIKEIKLPDSEKIYDQQFVREEEGEQLKVWWYDGTVRCYGAADGALLSEEKKDAPDKNLQEEFYTDKYKIVSDLHSAPIVYDLKTGKFVAELEKDDYLTYLYQAGNNLITEYISAEGNRYGLLLDENLQKIAYLPNLCDFVNGKLVFDDESGKLRQCNLYSLEELIALGESSLKGD